MSVGETGGTPGIDVRRGGAPTDATACCGSDETTRISAEKVILELLPPLPRTAKRLLNRLYFLLVVAYNRNLIADHRVSAEQLGKWAALLDRWPEAGKAIIKNPQLAQALEDAAKRMTISPACAHRTSLRWRRPGPSPGLLPDRPQARGGRLPPRLPRCRRGAPAAGWPRPLATHCSASLSAAAEVPGYPQPRRAPMRARPRDLGHGV